MVISLCSATAKDRDQHLSKQADNRGEGGGIPAIRVHREVGEAGRLDHLVSRKRADQGRRHQYHRHLHPGW